MSNKDIVSPVSCRCVAGLIRGNGAVPLFSHGIVGDNRKGVSLMVYKDDEKYANSGVLVADNKPDCVIASIT